MKNISIIKNTPFLKHLSRAFSTSEKQIPIELVFFKLIKSPNSKQSNSIMHYYLNPLPQTKPN